MIEILITWTAILIFAFGLGGGGICLCEKFIMKRASIVATWDTYIVLGLLLLNVYAEYFSLFYKVAGIALLLLVIIVIPLLGVLIRGKWITLIFRELSIKWISFFYVFLLYSLEHFGRVRHQSLETHIYIMHRQ